MGLAGASPRTQMALRAFRLTLTMTLRVTPPAHSGRPTRSPLRYRIQAMEMEQKAAKSREIQQIAVEGSKMRDVSLTVRSLFSPSGHDCKEWQPNANPVHSLSNVGACTLSRITSFTFCARTSFTLYASTSFTNFFLLKL